MSDHYVPIKFSKQFIGLIAIAYGISWVVIVMLSCVLWIKLILVILTTVYCTRILLQHALLKTAHSIHGLSFNPEGVQIHRASSIDPVLFQIDGSSTLTSLVCIIRLKKEDSFFKRSCVIFPDAFTPSFDVRKLRLLVNGYKKQPFA